jgi:hypothetical protein
MAVALAGTLLFVAVPVAAAAESVREVRGVAVAQGAVRVLGPVRISGASPFAPDCAKSSGYVSASSVQSGAEAEPSLAVNPADSRVIVAAYQEDRLKPGAALSNVASVSRDGGHTFKQMLLPGTSICSGGQSGFATDPVATFGPDGTAYVSSQLISGYAVSRWTAGQAAWQTSMATTTPLASTPGPPGTGPSDPFFFDDKDTLVADQVRSGHVYLGWDVYSGPRPAGVSGVTETVNLVASSDGGQAWSTPQAPAFGIPAADAQDWPQLVSLPNGALVLMFATQRRDSSIGLPDAPVQLFAVRSDDGGQTWSAPAPIAQVSPATAGVRDPGSGECVRTGGACEEGGFSMGFTAAAGPDGSVDAVWQQDESPTSGSIMRVRSTDGGLHWSQPTAAVRSPTQVFLPAVAVMADGTIGLSYDAFRHYSPGSPKLDTDVWLAISHDNGKSFADTAHLAGPFDMRTAPESTAESVGRFLGDYQGLVAFPDGFGADFAASAPLAQHGTSDIFFARAFLTQKLGLPAHLPASSTCRARRRLVIHLRSRRADPLQDASILVNGRRVRVVRGKGLRKRITLTGLPRGRFKLTVVAHTRSGRTLRTTRSYRACRA